MYLGHLIFLAGIAFRARLVARRGGVSCSTPRGSTGRVRDDEARLIALFGDPYREYLARVKRWIPGLL